ncbi:NADP-dependent oxidoreductase [Streptomyces gilvus]|uniref:NADP-dependent oxidoreductase n=1 Tax=Streptomyces gilvus TaxID=2920937 RepID=UPI001F0D8136|nr:NADP-dependent oxidoreductase [Streptomyces sp. CME 23]MCH5676890.1 NADP-dependent oxidoreductase [Streptomyces sp. CME 23]
MDTELATMRAVRGHRRGGPERLKYEVAPRPAPAADEVLVAVRSAAITSGELAWDATWTNSLDGTGSLRLPIVPAKEVSGQVVEAGSAVHDLHPGDEVFGLIPFTQDGAAAEFTAVPAAVLAAKPPSLDHDGAAALALPGLTAWQGLVRHAGLTPGDTVLVHGAAGGVGSMAVQIAVALGGKVIATAAGQDAEFVRALGAERVIDYTAQPFEDAVADVGVVFDAVGGDTQARSWHVLRSGGTLVSIVSPPGPSPSPDTHGVFFVVEPDRAGLIALSELVESGRLTPYVDRVVPLQDTAGAYAALEREHRRGKIVLRVS